MRILFDHQIFSLQSRGGISRYFCQLTSRLAQRTGIEIEVSAGLHRNLVLSECSEAWVRGYYVREWPKTTKLRNAINAYLSRRRAQRWRPDLVHETYYRTGSQYLTNVPSVLTVYDMIHFLFPENLGNSESVQHAIRNSIARADHVVCISETTRRDLLRLTSADPQRVSVIPLAGPKPRAKDATIPPRPDIQGPYLLHVGKRKGYKNFDLILRSLAEADTLRSHFNLVAFGDTPFTRTEVSRLQKLGLDPTRILHRNGDDLTLESYYAHAAAFICPSLYEGFGLPPLEAMAHGCPVLCSNRGSLKEVVGEAALLFDPTEPLELVKTLEALIKNPDLGIDLGARGLVHAGHFSWDQCVDETLSVYRSLIARDTQ